MRNALKLFLLLFFLGNINTAFATHAPFLKERSPISIKNWKFQKGDYYDAQSSDFNDSSWEEIKVPHTYSLEALTEVGYYMGIAWYRTNILESTYKKGERIYIRFEGVGQAATLYLNGEKLGKHEGSYSAFSFELTSHWNYEGDNLIALQTDNDCSHKIIPIDNFLFNVYGGIYRPVSLFSTPQVNITPTYYASPGLFIETKSIDHENANIEVRTHIENGSSSSSQSLEINVIDADGNVIITKLKNLNVPAGKKQIIKSTIDIANPNIWNAKQNPYLYSLQVKLTSNGTTDVVEQHFGVRSIEVDANKGFILNNEPYKLNGVCRHQEWQGVGPALSNEHHEADMDIMDEIGATAIRFAHYQQADYIYELADKKGMVVWAEIPFVHDWSGRETSNAKTQLSELILQNYNHPSICFWGLWNEVRAWGGESDACVSTTKELNKLAHQLDDSRLTTSASDRTIISPMELITDLQAWNKYFGWYYGDYEDLGSWLDKTHEENPNVKIAISEYGAGGNIAHQDNNKTTKPKGDYFAEQELTICHEKSWAALKDRDFVWGSFLWNMFDFSVNKWNRGGVPHMNHKGLVTFDRKTKKDAFYFYKANWSEEPTIYIAEYR